MTQKQVKTNFSFLANHKNENIKKNHAKKKKFSPHKRELILPFCVGA